MAYAEESTETKALLDNYAGNLRATLGEMARLVNTAEALQDQYNQEVSGIISSWGGSDAWPNASGLAGSSLEETKDQMVTWQSYLDTYLTQLGTSGHMGQYVSAAGPDNVLGG